MKTQRQRKAGLSRYRAKFLRALRKKALREKGDEEE